MISSYHAQSSLGWNYLNFINKDAFLALLALMDDHEVTFFYCVKSYDKYRDWPKAVAAHIEKEYVPRAITEKFRIENFLKVTERCWADQNIDLLILGSSALSWEKAELSPFAKLTMDARTSAGQEFMRSIYIKSHGDLPKFLAEIAILQGAQLGPGLTIF